MGSVEQVELHGLPAVKLSLPSGASAVVYVYAAHVASWKTADGAENLFVSSKTEYGGGKAIRGGIPICWPQFAAKGAYQKHGFCRNSAEWTVVRTSMDPYPCVVLGLKDSDATRALWPFPFSLRYAVTLEGDSSLSTSLSVSNSGEEPMEFTGALHTYFAAALATACIRGLEGSKYDDSVAGSTAVTEESKAVAFPGEVDRIYFSTPSSLYVVDGERAIKVLKMGWPDAVVWNIGGKGASGLKDLGEGEWGKYVCLEAATIGKAVKLAPATSWTAGQTFTLLTKSEAEAQLAAAAAAKAKVVATTAK